MITLLDELKEFMLTSNILSISMKDKYKERNKNKDRVKHENIKDKEKEEKNDIENEKDNVPIENTRQQGTNKILVPKEKDTLFWCFYIMKNGETEYEKIKVQYPNTFIIEKQIKFGYIDRIRKEKELVKSTKLITLSELENQLANETKININTFFTLCALENINIFYIGNNKTYFEYPDLSGVINYPSMHVVKRLDTHKRINEKEKDLSSGKKDMKRKLDTAFYGYEGVKEDTSMYRNQLLKLDRLDKPMKPISSYKLNELLEICTKLGIETSHTANKTKKELYDLIIDFL